MMSGINPVRKAASSVRPRSPKKNGPSTRGAKLDRFRTARGGGHTTPDPAKGSTRRVAALAFSLLFVNRAAPVSRLRLPQLGAPSG